MEIVKREKKNKNEASVPEKMRHNLDILNDIRVFNVEFDFFVIRAIISILISYIDSPKW